jgi:diguanylate cyclase (GGDEF)-like protein
MKAESKNKQETLNSNTLELYLIHECSLIVAKSKTIERAYEDCVSLICKSIEWPVAHIYFPDDTKKELTSSSIWCVDNKSSAKNLINITKKVSFDKKFGLLEKIWLSKKPVWISSLKSKKYFPDKKKSTDIEVQSVTGFPILVNKKIIAIFEFYSYINEDKNNCLLEIFEFLGEQLGYFFERKQFGYELDNLAHFDVVTGLPNRVFFLETLKLTSSRAKRLHQKFALMLINVDHFKQVNDNFGFELGDDFLKQLSLKIKSIAREMDYVAKISGDEFVIIIDNIPALATASAVALRLFDSIKQPLNLDGQEVMASISIGISVYPSAGISEDELLNNASSAMLRAKEIGGSAYMFYTDKLNSQIARVFEIEVNLRNAIEKNELYLVFQPQIDINNGSLAGVEVLLRWNSKKLGIVDPDVFIPIAESVGIMAYIGDWVLEESLKQLSLWSKYFPSLMPPMSINCSIAQLKNKKFVSFVKAQMESLSLKGEQFILEVTETMLMNDTSTIISQLNSLHRLNIRIAIDDFGTGYSSLSHLKKIPLSSIKIDKSFITNIAVDKSDEAVAGSVVHIGKKLNLKVVAEGIETKEQADILTKIGCNLMQGYLFSKPLKRDEFLAFLKKQQK